MIKEILTYPKDKNILTQVSENADWTQCAELIQDLKDTLHSDESGVGISAIQIGVPKRVCYIEHDGKELVMINPVITWRRHGFTFFKEGCLSAPGTFTMVPRSQKVICEYTDENGEKQKIAQGGWMSAIIQHELDHFEGDCAVFHAIEGE